MSQGVRSGSRVSRRGRAAYEDALAKIVGPRSEDGKEHRVGVTLRCEPKNKYDPSSVRVELMGPLVGYLPKPLPSKAAPGISGTRGAIKGQGVIVGGEKRTDDEATTEFASG